MKTNYQTLVDVVIKAEVAGNPRHELVLEVCSTPPVLLEVGFPQLNVIIKPRTIGKIFFDHGLTQRQIEKIPDILESPQAIYASETQPGNVVVFTYEWNLGSPVIMPMAANRRSGRTEVNEVLSMFAKEGPDPRPRWEAQGLLLWKPEPPKTKDPA